MTVESHALKAFPFLSLVMFMVFIASNRIQGSSLQEPMTIKHLSGPIYFLQSEEGPNLAASVGMDGILLIDADWKRNNEKITECLKGIKDVPVRIVINTHYHVDHVEGNEAFADSAVIISHNKARELRRCGLRSCIKA